MALYINHNMMAMNAARNLGNTYNNLGTSTQRLSSGLRINSAADDAAGLAIREQQRSDIAVLNQGVRNAGDAISMIQVADGALQVIDEKLIRMKELAEQAATGTYTDAQREIINDEFGEMAREITRIAKATDFNGRALLDGTLSGDGLTTGMKIHFGTGNDSAQDYYYIAMNNMTAEAMDVAVGNLSQASVAAQSSLASQASLTSQAAVTGVHASQGSIAGQESAASFAVQGSVGSQAVVTYRASRASTAIGFAVESQSAVASEVSRISYAVQASVGSIAAQSSIASQAVVSSQGSQVAVAFEASVASQVSITSHAAVATVASIASQASVASQALVDSQNSVAAQASQGSVATQAAVFQAVVASRGSFVSAAILTSQASVASRAATSGVSYASQAAQNAVTVQASVGSAAAFEGISSPVVTASVGFQAAVTGQDSVASQASLASQAAAASWGTRVDTQDGAQQALAKLDVAIVAKDSQRAELGAKSNRLENTITNLTIQAENVQAAESRISDVDVAEEMTTFTKNSIMAQAATAMLAQANALNRMAVQLIGG